MSRSDAAASSTCPSGTSSTMMFWRFVQRKRARAEPVGDVGDRDHLVAGEPSAERRRAQVVEARLDLRVDAQVVAVRIDGVAGHDRCREARGRACCSTSARSRSTPHSSTRNLIRARVRLVRLPSSRKISVIARHTSAASSGQHEGVEPPAHAGRRAEPAAHPDVVAHHAVLLDRHEADVVDLVLRAAVQAARHRHLELARQVREAAVADERPLELLDQRPRVDAARGRRRPRAGSRRRFATRRRRPG